VTFYRERVRFALEMLVLLEENAVGVPKVGAKRDVIAMRKLRIQTPGRFGSTIAQRPSADLLGNTINSPPQPAGFFFFPMYVCNSSASTHWTSEAGTAGKALPSTASSTQFMTELWLTPTSRCVARKPTPSK
jgi:hypothetical protein